MAYYSNMFSCFNPNGGEAPVQNPNIQNTSFSGKGRSLSDKVEITEQNVPSEEINSKEVVRQRLLNATMNRLNKN
jgi:hypothetical protein